MLPILFFTWLVTLPIASGIINCRTACRHCREKLEHPEMLEVYCAMCDECNERRREWLGGPPNLLRVEKNEEYLTNDGQQDSQDECETTPIDESCEQPQLLTQTLTTTASTTTTSTTTRKPCTPKPCTATIPCQSIACPIPMAIPVCPMCPMQMTGSFYTVAALPSSMGELTEVTPKKMTGRSATSELYFYLGVPKKLLKQLQLSGS
ncbi:uncharacterized protein LOC123868504 [Maniola jurtina]|uniref:uncharacterized protein LOC123868504 n=1 Tax=Maniola jurtina TaxID=191418 RepID=UPI001E68C194|nr:uncharacterized protein LOC123868504 [Maniola jurtina]